VTEQMPAAPAGRGVAYIVTHQAGEKQSPEAYLRNIRELHRRVTEEAARRSESVQKSVGELVGREVQVAFGALTQFLVTPLKSDQLEVKKILEEALRRALDAGQSASPYRFLETRLSRVLAKPPNASALRQHLEAGTAYHHQLGFRTAKGEVFESDFLVESAAAFELLEHIVRDRMGIYDGPHGKHIEEAGAWTFAAYNIVSEEQAQDGEGSLLVEVPLSKPGGMRYDAFRTAIGRLQTSMREVARVSRLGVWQRKLGLGPGREFLLRFECSDLDGAADVGLRVFPLLRDMISSLETPSPGSFPLIIKEILSPT